MMVYQLVLSSELGNVKEHIGNVNWHVSHASGREDMLKMIMMGDWPVNCEDDDET